jgi:hypothetical protein
VYNALLKTLHYSKPPPKAMPPPYKTLSTMAQTSMPLIPLAALSSHALSPLTGKSVIIRHTGVNPLISRWETIDASDASFMSEDRLNVLRIAVSHPDISLYTLNAPQDSINDVTPLGMAAWLDMPDVVQLLLECSSGAVSVDGMDTDGATPLMCKSARSSLGLSLP